VKVWNSRVLSRQQRGIGWATANHRRESSYSRPCTAFTRLLWASFGPFCNQVCNTRRRTLKWKRRLTPQQKPPANSKNKGVDREITPPRMDISRNNKCQQRQGTLKVYQSSPDETSTLRWKVRMWIFSMRGRTEAKLTSRELQISQAGHLRLCNPPLLTWLGLKRTSVVKWRVTFT
jgi:hypothetical protein